MGCGCGKSSSSGSNMSQLLYVYRAPDGSTSEPGSRTEAERLLRDAGGVGRVEAVRVTVDA